MQQVLCEQQMCFCCHLNEESLRGCTKFSKAPALSKHGFALFLASGWISDWKGLNSRCGLVVAGSEWVRVSECVCVCVISLKGSRLFFSPLPSVVWVKTPWPGHTLWSLPLAPPSWAFIDSLVGPGYCPGEKDAGFTGPRDRGSLLDSGRVFRCVHNLRNGAQLFCPLVAFPSPTSCGLSVIRLDVFVVPFFCCSQPLHTSPKSKKCSQLAPNFQLYLLCGSSPQMLECPFQSQ